MARLTTLNSWLDWQKTLHNKSIDLSIERVKKVYKLLFKQNVSFKVITIAGTNGKGSTAAFIESIYTQTRFKVGKFSSPHIDKYNERFAVNGAQVSDAKICNAFATIEAARGRVSLTYFEFSALAALIIFTKYKVDVAILEVGLGGRFDAVNVVDADISVITNIDIDHTDYLGDNREQIGFEKAHIMRSNKICICGDNNPPKSIKDYAKKINAKLKFINTNYNLKIGLNGKHQQQNANLAIQAVQELNLIPAVSLPQIKQGLEKTKLRGRLQKLKINHKTIILDVAHNTAAVKALANSLAEDKTATVAIFFALKDKNISLMIDAMSAMIDKWFLVHIDVDRATPINKLKAVFDESYKVQVCDMITAVNNAVFNEPHPRVVIFGSFYTIAAATKILNTI